MGRAGRRSCLCRVAACALAAVARVALAGEAEAERALLALVRNATLDVMLVRRPDGRWDLPGGRADATDESLMHTAQREATEELGRQPPSCDVTGPPARISWVGENGGKGKNNRGVVFPCVVYTDTAPAWEPATGVLVAWVSPERLASRSLQPLHARVEALLDTHPSWLASTAFHARREDAP